MGKRHRKDRARKDKMVEDRARSAGWWGRVALVLLLGIFGLSFYIRGILPLESAFRYGIPGFAMDDAVFHMRLVENTIYNFPTRIFFDAFTMYPFGNHLHWGPLFDQSIAFLALVFGRILDGGLPSQATIDAVGMFYPAVLGALVVFPVYVVGRELAGRRAGLVGAFLIAVMPGQFLNRSVLGFTDNHVAETLFLAVSVAFFVLALKRSESIRFDSIKRRDWPALRPVVMYSVLMGVSLGVYLLNWTAGIFFVAVFVFFVVVQTIVEALRGRSADYLCIISVIAFPIALLMVVPYVDAGNGFDSAYYSLLHVTVLVFAVLVPFVMTMVYRVLRFSKAYYLLGIVLLAYVGMQVLVAALPGLYATTLGNTDIIFRARAGGQATVAEAMPLGASAALGNFGLNYYFAYFALGLLIYYFTKKMRPDYLLVFIWSVIVLMIMLAQNRFAYYYAVNASILVGVLASRILDFAGWDKLFSPREIRWSHAVCLVAVIAAVAFLPPNSSPYFESTKNARWGALAPGFYEWYEAMTWMRNNTPDPGLDYYAVYKMPANSKYPYSYPETAYGVMSWWDYGHVITYWGHRIPNANPFQAGIGGGPSHASGASTFLTSQSEREGYAIMDELGSMYVVTDAYMAYSIQPVFAVWNEDNSIRDPAMDGLTSRPDPLNYYISFLVTSRGNALIPGAKMFRSMAGRLHILDGDGLQRLRLVHESPPSPSTLGAKGDSPEMEIIYRTAYNMLYGGSIKVENTGYVKIFEYVNGAKIAGTAPPNTTIMLSNTIKTNLGRTFNYIQRTSSNEYGKYSFTVPYWTSRYADGEARYVAPLGPYEVAAGNITKKIDVDEEDVLVGKTISLDFS